ncbi:MAG: hypothetical protein LDL47_05185 [Cyanobacteria bacterium KgW148]|nr:hypothetical protein [Cyanobacteria bacterium KgW148]
MEEPIGKLRRKEGTWVEWGQWCQELQKSGLTPQVIFEQTGLEPVQQNQLIGAAQVFSTIGDASAGALQFFMQKGSASLYELRILPQADRVKAAELIWQLQLNPEESRLLAKAMKEFALIDPPPPHFTDHPGDAVAYQAFKACQSIPDLAQRTQLISRGLRYAHSESARKQIEQLLTAPVSPPPIPRLPLYRLDSDEQLPRIFPVAGKFPLSPTDWSQIPVVAPIEPFALVHYEGKQAWIALPGWKVVQDIEDGIIVLADTDSLFTYSGQKIPSSFPDRGEEILLLIDRAQRQWDRDGYFLVAEADSLYLRQVPPEPKVKLWGRLMLVLRQPRVLEDTIGKDPWILEE